MSDSSINQNEQAREAERAVLGGLMLETHRFDTVIQVIKDSDFHLPQHQIIFQSMAELVESNQPLDPITVSEKLDNKNYYTFHLSFYLFDMVRADRDRSKHWKEYYSTDIAPSGPSSFAEKVLTQIEFGQHILDIGCGNGRDSIFFSENGIQVDAIDRSESAIDLCKSKYIDSEINFSYGELLTLQIKDLNTTAFIVVL